MKILSLFISLLMCGILSANTLSLEDNGDGTWNVNYITDDEIGRFQFNVDDATINSTSGGTAGFESDNVNLPSGKWLYFWSELLNIYTKLEGKSII